MDLDLTHIQALAESAGIRPELVATFIAHSIAVAKVLYPAAKASPLPRVWRSPAVYFVTAIVGGVVAHLDGVPVVWGIATTLAAAATAMAAHDTASAREAAKAAK
jgi:hypothetical protein